MLTLQEAAARLIEHLLERPDGPMAFRFVLQPIMAAIVAIRDGIRDGKSGAPPYFLTIIRPSDRRRAALLEGLRATSRILILAVVLDAIYQISVYRTFHPGETVIIGFLLAFLPYVLIRGPVSRLVKMAKTGPGGNKNRKSVD
jgi:hypothetical protein